MKCLICGRASQPGAKLCADCSSARKRAFAATVTQPLLAASGRSRGGLLRPSQSMAATARRAAERAMNATPPAGTAAAPSRRMDIIFLAVALIVVLLLGGYIARQLQKSRQANAAQVAEQPATVTPGSVSNTVSLVPPGMSPKNVAETGPSGTTGAMPVDESTPVPATKVEPVKRLNARQRSAPVEVPPTVEPVPAAPVAVAPAPPPAPEVREVPKPDPVQQLNESLSRCAGAGLFDRILCDQRVRREYCEGRWGQVPQCPSGVANDRGQ